MKHIIEQYILYRLNCVFSCHYYGEMCLWQLQPENSAVYTDSDYTALKIFSAHYSMHSLPILSYLKKKKEISQQATPPHANAQADR